MINDEHSLNLWCWDEDSISTMYIFWIRHLAFEIFLLTKVFLTIAAVSVKRTWWKLFDSKRGRKPPTTLLSKSYFSVTFEFADESMLSNLINRSFEHSLIDQASQFVENEVQNSFVYVVDDCYSFSQFHEIMIDIEAFKHSTADYD